MQLGPGAVIGGKYRVERVLGEGGMGVVYEARHDALGTTVAVKVLRDEVLRDREAVARFEREARAAAALRSPHAARVLDVGEIDGVPFMVMELLVGNDLGEELERRGPLPVGEAVDYLVQACEAIAEAHGLGIVHRDLKPANLYLTGAPPRRHVKVLDFGISRFDRAGEARVTQTQSAFGTPLYMSPEAVRSAKHTDARSDVWSFGVMLYELLTGLPPFIADTPTGVAVAVTVDIPRPIRAARPDVPEAVEAVVSRALEKDAARRYANAAELRDALLEAIGERGSPSPPLERDRAPLPLGAGAVSQRILATTPSLEPISGAAPPAPARRLAAILGVALVTALLTVAAGVLVFRGRGDPPLASSREPAPSESARRSSTTPEISEALQLATNPQSSSAPVSASAQASATAPALASGPQPPPSASSARAATSAPSAAAVNGGAPAPSAGSPPPPSSPPPPPPPATNTTAGGNPRRL